MLVPPEGLRAPELPGVHPGGRPQESGGDSKAMAMARRALSSKYENVLENLETFGINQKILGKFGILEEKTPFLAS